MGDTDPTIVAARAILDEALDGMREAIVGVPTDVLDRRPSGEGTNSLAVLAVHSMHSTRMWLSVAMGTEVPDRDRPSEFVAEAGSAERLQGSFDGMAAECRTLLAEAEDYEPGALRQAPPPRAGGDEPVTAAWALLHALEHLGEHVAHAQLTRQLLDRT